MTHENESIITENLTVAAIQEWKDARCKFPAFHSPHEAYAVILEELDEYWGEVKRDGTKERMREELIQVMAMTIAAIMETTR